MKNMKLIKIKKQDANEPEPAGIDIRKEMTQVRKEIADAIKGLKKWEAFCKSSDAAEMYGEQEAQETLKSVQKQIQYLNRVVLPLMNKFTDSLNYPVDFGPAETAPDWMA